MKELICKKCGFQWVPRTAKPKACPECKSRSWNEQQKTKKETV